MRYKTKVTLVWWVIMGPLMIAGVAALIAQLASNPGPALHSLAVRVVFTVIGFFLINRLFPLPSIREMAPDEQDAEYARRVAGTAMGLQMIAACFALATAYAAVSKLRSGAGWDHDAGDVCVFSIFLFLGLYPVRRHANRHLPAFRPGQDTLTFIVLASLLVQIVAAPTAFFALLFLIGQLEYGQGWNGNFAAVCAIAALAYYGMHQWRRWARKHFPASERADAISPDRSSPDRA